jgi:hypothetical protein
LCLFSSSAHQSVLLCPSFPQLLYFPWNLPIFLFADTGVFPRMSPGEISWPGTCVPYAPSVCTQNSICQIHWHIICCPHPCCCCCCFRWSGSAHSLSLFGGLVVSMHPYLHLDCCQHGLIVCCI